FDQLEHERRSAIRVLEAEDGADVGMAERRQQACLALESDQTLGFPCEMWGQDLDGDVAPQLRVARTIDLAHPADAEQRLYLVRAEPTAGEAPACVGRSRRARRGVV